MRTEAMNAFLSQRLEGPGALQQRLSQRNFSFHYFRPRFCGIGCRLLRNLIIFASRCCVSRCCVSLSRVFPVVPSLAVKGDIWGRWTVFVPLSVMCPFSSARCRTSNHLYSFILGNPGCTGLVACTKRNPIISSGFIPNSFLARAQLISLIDGSCLHSGQSGWFVQRL